MIMSNIIHILHNTKPRDSNNDKKTQKTIKMADISEVK